MFVNLILAQEIKEGFRGHEWGRHLDFCDSSLELTFGYGEEHLEAYSAAIDSLGGAKLEHCIFMFYKKQLCGVTITTKGRTNSDKLLRAAKAVYGEPDQPNPYIEKYRWKTSRTVRTFEQNLITKDASLIMMSIPHMQWRERDKEKEAQKAKDEF